MTFFAGVRYLGLAALFLGANNLWAQGDVNKGRELTYTCSGCHGIANYKNAYPQYHVPKIAGQNYDYLVAALQGYKKAERAHPTMRAQAKSFSDADIIDIATYLSTASEHAK